MDAQSQKDLPGLILLADTEGHRVGRAKEDFLGGQWQKERDETDRLLFRGGENQRDDREVRGLTDWTPSSFCSSHRICLGGGILAQNLEPRLPRLALSRESSRSRASSRAPSFRTFLGSSCPPFQFSSKLPSSFVGLWNFCFRHMAPLPRAVACVGGKHMKVALKQGSNESPFFLCSPVRRGGCRCLWRATRSTAATTIPTLPTRKGGGRAGSSGGSLSPSASNRSRQVSAWAS